MVWGQSSLQNKSLSRKKKNQTKKQNNNKSKQGLVTQACNPSYLEVWVSQGDRAQGQPGKFSEIRC